MYVRVAVNIPRDKTFSYSIPVALAKEAVTGKRVVVPFGKKVVTGYILETNSSEDVDNIKEIIEVPDSEPCFSEQDLLFYRWVSQYYLYPLGKTLFDILPGGKELKKDIWVSLSGGAGGAIEEISAAGVSAVGCKIMETLIIYPQGLPLVRLQRLLEGKDNRQEIEALQKRGLINTDCRYQSPVSPKKEKLVSLGSAFSSMGKYGHPRKFITIGAPRPVAGKTNQESELTPDSGWQDLQLSNRQGQVVAFLRQHGATLISTLRLEFNNATYLVGCLQKKGVVHIEEKEVYRTSRELPVLDVMDRPICLNADQERAVHEILPGLVERRFSPYLLHGVTGSGKTEVYLRLIEKTRELEGGTIFLVPEIGLTPQLMARIAGRFGEQEIAVIHSGVSKVVRYDQWRRIQRGEVKIVIGARSALFVPMNDLRLIIVDEEHDGSYKQDDRLRYNARDMAIVKAKLNSATVILGSATPAIQTYFNARNKKYHYLTLPRRIENRDLPVVRIVDMRTVREGNSAMPIISPMMQEEIARTLAEKKQTLLFLNRRGFDTVLLCPACGYVFKCLNCELTLTHHAAAGILKCHYCDYAIKATSSCPSCHGNNIRSYGLGTEKLEEEVKRIFPHARVGRMDSDTTARRGEAERILRALAMEELDILVGTQMITKGHDFPSITLVGVVAADLSLNVPDFRAGERTFQILTQVAGRGGRGSAPGLVVVQTFNPDHYAVKRAQHHDYNGFYEDEIKLRKNLFFPPYTRLVNLHISSVRKDRGSSGVDMIGKLARRLSIINKIDNKIEILGPAEAPVAKIRGRYRWQLLLKSKDIKAQILIVDAIRMEAAKCGLELKIDVDPMNFM